MRNNKKSEGNHVAKIVLPFFAVDSELFPLIKKMTASTAEIDTVNANGGSPNNNHASYSYTAVEGSPLLTGGKFGAVCTYCQQRRNWGLYLALIVTLAVSISVALEVSYKRNSSSPFLKEENVCGLEPNPIMKLKESSSVEGVKNGAVATDHPICSQVGIDILQDLGGNAVDAAVAVALCLGVANPASSGIGGGMFMLIHSDRKHHEERLRSRAMPDFVDARNNEDKKSSSEKVTELIDARETAPGAAHTEMFVNSTLIKASEKGGLAVAVLGELKGLELAHARHGFLEWSQVVEPAFKLARDGVVVLQHLAGDISHQTTNFEKYNLQNLAKLLSKGNDCKTFLKEGDILKNPALANTLHLVMDQGADAVYTGPLANSLAQDVQEAGGIITEHDINSYKATLRSPLIGEASGFTIVGPPPPSSGGGAIIGILRFLANFASPLAAFADGLSMHRLVEAMRHAFAIRMSLADPAFFPETVQAAVADLVSGDYMKSLLSTYKDNETARLSLFGGPTWAKLNDSDGKNFVTDAHEGDRRRRLGKDTHGRKLYRRFGYLEDHGTTHFSVVDSQGNAVSMTSSINTYFGSGVVSPSTGIVLNNQMDDFGTPGKPNYYGLRPSEENFVSPRKKPLSSMSPTMVFKQDGFSNGVNSMGDLFMALGASGGPKIITAVVQVIINHAHLGMPLFEAVVHPRIHDQLLYHSGDVTTMENSVLDQGPIITVQNRTKLALMNRGHLLTDIDYAGTVQAISIDFESKTLTAVSDIRKGGLPCGY